jgi:hypothetical protein
MYVVVHLTRRVQSNATASNNNEGDRDGDRSRRDKRDRRVRGKSVQGAAKEVAQVERGSKAGVQRDVQLDVREPKPVPAPASGQDQQSHVAHDGLERGLDSGRRGVKQRWTREAYNAYQREYMRKRRAGLR